MSQDFENLVTYFPIGQHMLLNISMPSEQTFHILST